MMHCVKGSDKRRRGQLEHLAQKMQELNPDTSENYSTVCVCVCVRACVRVCVCHNTSPTVMVSKQCSNTFIPAFSFIARTGTALTIFVSTQSQKSAVHTS